MNKSPCHAFHREHIVYKSEISPPKCTVNFILSANPKNGFNTHGNHDNISSPSKQNFSRKVFRSLRTEEKQRVYDFEYEDNEADDKGDDELQITGDRPL